MKKEYVPSLGVVERKKDVDMAQENIPYHQFINELSWKYFYGNLSLSFENGRITHCKKEESIKL